MCSLLSERDALPVGREARKHLFSERFLARQLKKAQKDITLSRVDKAAAEAESAALAAKCKKQNSNIRYIQAEASTRHQNRGGGGFKSLGFQAKRGGFQKARRKFNSNRRYDTGSVDEPTVTLPLVPSVSPHLKVVETKTEEPWVLATVGDGLSIDFISTSSQDVVPGDIDMTEEMICDAKIANLVEKGATIEITDDLKDYVCAFFCISKNSKGLFRPIVNIRPVNKCIRYEHFKMENLNSVRFLVRKGDWMVKVDL